MSQHRRFANIPEEQVLRSDWRNDGFLRELAQAAREVSLGRLKTEYRRILGLCVMLEEAEAGLASAEERVAALETVNDEQAQRIEELEKKVKGLELTVGRMKKRK